MLRSSWVYSLKRDELVSQLNEFELDASGTVEELRKRLAKFVSAEHNNTVQSRLMELQGKYELPTTSAGKGTPATSPMKLEGSKESGSVSLTVPNITFGDSRTGLMERVRKWGLTYSGDSEPLAFTERLEELAELYDVSLDVVPRLMPEFLQGRALVWFRNNNRHWQVWREFKSDFLAFFLPARYFEQLEDAVRARTQRPSESFKDYLLEIQNLMRHSSMSAEQKLQRIFQNTRSEYQLYIKRKDFTSLTELTQLAEDLEAIPVGSTPTDGNRSRANPALTNPPARACFNCGQNGHYAARCPSNNLRPAGNGHGGRRN